MIFLMQFGIKLISTCKIFQRPEIEILLVFEKFTCAYLF